MILHYKFDSLVDNRYYEGDWNGVYQDDLLTYSRIKNISYNGILKISKNKNNKKYYKEIIHEIINRIINWPYGMTGIFKSLDSTLKQDIAFDVKNKELQILLAKDDDVHIRMALAGNKSIDTKTIDLLLNDNDTRVKDIVMKTCNLKIGTNRQGLRIYYPWIGD